MLFSTSLPTGRNSLPRALVAAASACLGMAAWTPAAAVNLGVHGQLYPIQEPHLIREIQAKLLRSQQNGEIDAMRKKQADAMRSHVENPPPIQGLTPTFRTLTHYYDPTFTLTHNVLDHKGNLLFPAGTSKNPLEVVSMDMQLLFFDARDPRQVAYAERVLSEPNRPQPVRPVLVGGSFLDLSTKWERAVYYDQMGLLVRRFGIQHVPALVYQEGMRLRIDQLALKTP